MWPTLVIPRSCRGERGAEVQASGQTSARAGSKRRWTRLFMLSLPEHGPCSEPFIPL